MMRHHLPALLLLTASGLVLASAAGCADGPAPGHGPEGEHAHDDHAGDHGHGHDAHGGASEAITRWGETTQLFVEFPALVVDQQSAFAAHLTRLEDHRAIGAGEVVVELTAGGTTETFSADAPTVPGIFRPVVTPTRLGPHTLTLRLEGPEATEVHAMGSFTVFPSRAQADAAAGEEAESDEISYLLEQQWKVPFQVEAVASRVLRPSVPAFARLVLPNHAASTVLAPKSGRLLAGAGQFPSVGSTVGAGERLLTLSTAPSGGADPASLELAVAQATIEVASAQREVDRLLPLVTQGVVAGRRLDEANSELSRASASLKSATRRQKSLGQSQRVGGRGENVPVPAPIGGTVAEVFVAPGAWVTEGQPLARVVDTGRLWLDVGAPEAYLPKLVHVSGVWFRLDHVEAPFELAADTLVSVGTEVDTETRTLPVRFRVDNAEGALFAGMTTLAHLIVDHPREVLAVPTEAVVDDAGTDVVYVQTGGESFVRRPVQLGILDAGRVEVTSGLDPGEWVVTRGAWQVRLASQSTAAIGHGHAH